jgi:hypothetical protein
MYSRAKSRDSSRFCTAGEAGVRPRELARRILRVNVGVAVGVTDIVSVDKL